MRLESERIGTRKRDMHRVGIRLAGWPELCEIDCARYFQQPRCHFEFLADHAPAARTLARFPAGTVQSYCDRAETGYS